MAQATTAPSAPPSFGSSPTPPSFGSWNKPMVTEGGDSSSGYFNSLREQKRKQGEASRRMRRGISGAAAGAPGVTPRESPFAASHASGGSTESAPTAAAEPQRFPSPLHSPAGNGDHRSKYMWDHSLLSSTTCNNGTETGPNYPTAGPRVKGKPLLNSRKSLPASSLNLPDGAGKSPGSSGGKPTSQLNRVDDENGGGMQELRRSETIASYGNPRPKLIRKETSTTSPTTPSDGAEMQPKPKEVQPKTPEGWELRTSETLASYGNSRPKVIRKEVPATSPMPTCMKNPEEGPKPKEVQLQMPEYGQIRRSETIASDGKLRPQVIRREMSINSHMPTSTSTPPDRTEMKPKPKRVQFKTPEGGQLWRSETMAVYGKQGSQFHRRPAGSVHRPTVPALSSTSSDRTEVKPMTGQPKSAEGAGSCGQLRRCETLFMFGNSTSIQSIRRGGPSPAVGTGVPTCSSMPSTTKDNLKPKYVSGQPKLTEVAGSPMELRRSETFSVFGKSAFHLNRRASSSAVGPRVPTCKSVPSVKDELKPKPLLSWQPELAEVAGSPVGELRRSETIAMYGRTSSWTSSSTFASSSRSTSPLATQRVGQGSGGKPTQAAYRCPAEWRWDRGGLENKETMGEGREGLADGGGWRTLSKMGNELSHQPSGRSAKPLHHVPEMGSCEKTLPPPVPPLLSVGMARVSGQESPRKDEEGGDSRSLGWSDVLPLLLESQPKENEQGHNPKQKWKPYPFFPDCDEVQTEVQTLQVKEAPETHKGPAQVPSDQGESTLGDAAKSITVGEKSPGNGNHPRQVNLGSPLGAPRNSLPQEGCLTGSSSGSSFSSEEHKPMRHKRHFTLPSDRERPVVDKEPLPEPKCPDLDKLPSPHPKWPQVRIKVDIQLPQEWMGWWKWPKRKQGKVVSAPL